MGTREAVLTCTHNLCFEPKKNIKHFLLKMFNFYNLKNRCILHGRVFIMFNAKRAHYDLAIAPC